jgi:hypothetical protein
VSGERQVTARLPPDFETVDTVIAERRSRPGPKIFEQHVRNPFVLRACQKNELVIPGARLWRSAMVTVGGQPADRIIVLPNMQGIHATFDPLELPSSFSLLKDGKLSEEHLARWLRTVPEDDDALPQPALDEKVVSTELKVWTSEGVDRLGGNDGEGEKVLVLLPKTGQCPPPDGSN